MQLKSFTDELCRVIAVIFSPSMGIMQEEFRTERRKCKIKSIVSRQGVFSFLKFATNIQNLLQVVITTGIFEFLSRVHASSVSFLRPI